MKELMSNSPTIMKKFPNKIRGIPTIGEKSNALF